jgi:hypothetical protein
MSSVAPVRGVPLGCRGGMVALNSGTIAAMVLAAAAAAAALAS